MKVFSTPAKSQTIKTASPAAFASLLASPLEKVSTQITWLRELCGLLGVGAVFRFVSMYSTISFSNGIRDALAHRPS